MGHIYSKPGAANPRTQANAPSAGSQNHRPRDISTNVSQLPCSDALSNATLEALARLQGGSPQVATRGSAPELAFNPAVHRPSRNQDVANANACLLTNEILAAAQLGGQLTPAQLNALLAACQQQQQQQQPQLQRPSASFNLASLSMQPSNSSPSPSPSAHLNRSGPSHLGHAPSAAHAYHQKRPGSGHSQYSGVHGSQSAPGRPPSVSQLAQASQRNPHQLQGVHGAGHYPSHHPLHHLSAAQLEPPAALAAGHVARRSPGSGNHSHHGGSVSTTSPCQSPVLGGYQGRRSQAAPPNPIPTKRPRLSGSLHPSVQQQPQSHGSSSSHASGIPAGVEALMSTLVANKAMASLTSCAGFLNPSAYNSATEAAVVALSPLFSAAMNSGGAGNQGSSGPNQNNFPPHFSAVPQPPPHTTSSTVLQPDAHLISSSISPFSNPLLSGSLSNSRSSYPTSLAQPHNPPSVVGQSVHPTANQLKSHPVGIPTLASRLGTEHLSHAHLGGHAPPHNFHNPPHALSHSGTGHHHLLGHANLTHGSGVLRQQTKEPAYHPQVEAISPAPEESRLADAQDAKIHREREELSRKLGAVEAELNKQSAHQRYLEERETRLTTRLASTGGNASATHLDGRPSPKLSLAGINERAFENPIQAFIAENRQRAMQHHLVFSRLCGPHVKASPYALPVYRQPSDLAHICALRNEFRQHFRPKLIRYLRRRRKAEQARIQYLAQQYAHHSAMFTKKVEKLLNNSKQRHRESRQREFFERMLPEVKKNREDREMSTNEGSKPTATEDESSNQSANGQLLDDAQTPLYDPVEEMNKMKEYAIDPPIMLAPWQRRYRFIYQSGLVSDCRAQLQEDLDLSKWTEEDKQIFRERYLATPKNFSSIASYLEGKTVADCIHYYYLSKKKEGYKQLLKKHTARRRRVAQSDRGNNAGGGGSGPGHPPSGAGPPTSGSNGNFYGSSLPSTSPSISNNSQSNTEVGNGTSDRYLKSTNRREHSAGTSSRSRGNRGRSGASSRVHSTLNADASSSTVESSADIHPELGQTNKDHSTSLGGTISKEPSVPLESSDQSGMNSRKTQTQVVAPQHADDTKSSSVPCSDTDSSVCIKDIIHLAIEKNLAQSWSHDSRNQQKSDSQHPRSQKSRQPCSSHSPGPDVSHKTPVCASSASRPSIAPTNDFYVAAAAAATAAQLATENANTGDLASAIYAAAAAAAAAACSAVTHTNGAHSVAPGQEERRVNTAAAAAVGTSAAVTSTDTQTASKAILFGDFLTAQKLDHQSGPSVTPNEPPQTCNAATLSAEHAAWLALHAQAAAAAAVATSGEHDVPRWSDPSTSLARPYSPLSPAPISLMSTKPPSDQAAIARSTSPSQLARRRTSDPENRSHSITTNIPSQFVESCRFNSGSQQLSRAEFQPCPFGVAGSLHQADVVPQRPRSSELIHAFSVKNRTPVRPGHQSLGSPRTSPEQGLRHPHQPRKRSFPFNPDVEETDTEPGSSRRVSKVQGEILDKANQESTRGIPDLSKPVSHISPATFIDALIQSHLNSSESDVPSSKSRQLINPPSLPEKTTERVFEQNVPKSEMQPTIHAPSSRTLEEQINKAITEEIHAQLRSSASQHSQSGPEANSKPHPGNQTSTPSIVLESHPGTIPIKKRDRLILAVEKAVVESDVDRNTVLQCKQKSDDVLSMGEAPLNLPNGTRPVYFLPTKVDPRMRSRTGSTESSVDGVQEQGPGLASSPVSSVSEEESPGKLQIDLAAPNFSPDTEGRLSELKKEASQKNADTSPCLIEPKAVGAESCDLTTLRLWLPNDIRRVAHSQESSPMESPRSIVNRST